MLIYYQYIHTKYIRMKTPAAGEFRVRVRVAQ